MISDEEIQNQRESKYGPWRANMAGTTQQIAGMLTQMLNNRSMRVIDSGGYQRVELDDWAAPMLMALVKLNRAGSGVPHADNFVDARNYMMFAEEMQKEGQ